MSTATSTGIEQAIALCDDLEARVCAISAWLDDREKEGGDRD